MIGACPWAGRSPVGPSGPWRRRQAMWDDVEIAEPDGHWVQLEETAWDALIAWAAGARNLRRAPGVEQGRLVRVTTQRGEFVEVYEERRGERDQKIIDDSIDEVLVDAGMPPRPRQCRWFLRIPDGWDSPDSFLIALREALNTAPRSGSDPLASRTLIERVVSGFYA
ncbi:DUF5956 family protein [Sinomonas sp. ASV322]|uniref:DUF5956 family protein n=1 Tax=Sinomonas sp. ASV322 TaxID=3041920 RepID=UPI0035A3758F